MAKTSGISVRSVEKILVEKLELASFPLYGCRKRCAINTVPQASLSKVMVVVFFSKEWYLSIFLKDKEPLLEITMKQFCENCTVLFWENDPAEPEFCSSKTALPLIREKFQVCCPRVSLRTVVWPTLHSWLGSLGFFPLSQLERENWKSSLGFDKWCEERCFRII